MRLTSRRLLDRGLRLLILAIWITGCGSPTQQPPTSTPETQPTSAPSAPPATATSTPTTTPTPTPTIALPVRFQGDYPRPTEALGASADQAVVELARWGNGSLNQLALAPDGKTLLAATTAGFALFDVPGLSQRSVQVAPESVVYAAFAPDGTRLAIAGKGFVQIYSTADATLIDTVATDLEPLAGDQPFAFAPDGTTWAVLTAEAVRIRSVADGQELHEIALNVGAQTQLSGVRYLPDGSLIVVSRGSNAEIRRLDPATGQVAYATTAGGLAKWVVSDHVIGFVQSLTASRLTWLDATTGKTLGGEELATWVYDLRLSPDETVLAVATGDDQICTWHLPDGARWGCQAAPVDFRGAPFASGGGLLVPAKDGHTLNVRDPQSRAILASFARPADSSRVSFRKVLLAERGLIFVLTTSLQIEIWDEATTGLLGAMPAFSQPRDFRGLTFVPQSQTALPIPPAHDLLVLNNLYQGALALDLTTGSEIDLGGGVRFSQAVLAADGTVGAFLAGNDLTLAQNGATRVLASMGSITDFTNLALSPDGRLLAAAYRWKNENNIHLWDVRQGAEVGLIAFAGEWYQNRVAALSFSPDTQRLAVIVDSSSDARVQVFDVADPAAPTRVFSAGDQQVGYARALTYTPDGAHLVLGELYGTIRFLSTTDYATTGLQFDAGVGPMALGFLEDGRVLAIAGADNLAHLWGVNPQPTTIAAIAAVAETATATARAPGTPVPAAGTPYATPAAALGSANGANVVALARWGAGETRGLAVSADGRMAALATALGIELFALPALEPIGLIETTHPVQRVTISPDGAYLAAELIGFGDVQYGAWSIRTGEPVYLTDALPPLFQSDPLPTLPFDFAPDGRTLAVLTDREILFVDLAGRRIAERMSLPIDMRVTGLHFTQRGAGLALVGAGVGSPSGLRWVDVATRTFRPAAPIADEPLVASNADGSRLALAVEDATAHVSLIQTFDAATGAAAGTNLVFAPDVSALALSADGTQLAALSANGALCLWNVVSGEQRVCLAKPVGSLLRQLAFSADGAYVVAASSAQVLIWTASDLTPIVGQTERDSGIRNVQVAGAPANVIVQTTSGLSLRGLEPEQTLSTTADGDVLDLALAPGGTSLFMAGVWGIAQQALESNVTEWQVSDGAVALELSTDGRRLAAARPDGRIALYALPGGAAPRLLDGLSEAATGLAWLRGDRVLIAWNATEARLWTTADGKALPAPTPMPTHLVTVLDGETAGLPGDWVGLDDTVTTGVWAVDSGAQIGVNPALKGRVAPLLAGVMRLDGLLLLGPNGLNRLDGAGRPAWTYAVQPPPLPGIAISTSGDTIAVGDATSVALLNGAGELLVRLPVAPDVIALGDRNDTIALAHGDQVEVWQITARVVGGHPSRADGHYALTFATNAGELQTGLPDQSALVWTSGAGTALLDSRSGASLGTLDTTATRLVVSVDMQTVAEVALDGGLTVRRLGHPTQLFSGRDGYVSDVALSADGLRLAAVVTRGTARSIEIWNTTDARLAATIRESGVMFDHVALDPEGRRLAASAGWNADVRVYDLTQGANPDVLVAIAQRGVTALAYSPDGTQLAIGDLSGRVTLLATQDPTTVLAGFNAHGSAIQALAYFADATVLATAGDDGTLRLWGVAR